MTLVDAETGEVVDQADLETATKLVAECSSAIAHMNARTGQAIEAILDAYKAKVWIALGFGSWDELVDAKNWRWNPLTSVDRAGYSNVLRTNGMSIRAIAKVAGVSTSTVHSDTRCSEIEHVSGTDGKTYSATKPERPQDPDLEELLVDEEEPDDAHSDEDSTDTPAVDVEVSPTEVGTEQPTSEPVVGVTGSTLPSGPVTPSVDLDDFADPRDKWQALFARKTAAVSHLIALFPVDDVIDNADAEQLDDLADTVRRLNEWANQIAARRPNGLRVVQGGKQ